jgi:hypothetical protein
MADDKVLGSVMVTDSVNVTGYVETNRQERLGVLSFEQLKTYG